VSPRLSAYGPGWPPSATATGRTPAVKNPSSGFSASQILEVIEHLRAEDALASLQLLHFHLGSQIANIRDIQTGLRECARFYRALHEARAPVATIDIGGGLGVDYEGTRSRSACSMNYSMDEYARHVIQTFSELCAETNLPHPDLISESGRALTAHHAVLVTNVVDQEDPGTRIPEALRDDAPAALRNLWNDHRMLQEADSSRSPSRSTTTPPRPWRTSRPSSPTVWFRWWNGPRQRRCTTASACCFNSA